MKKWAINTLMGGFKREATAWIETLILGGLGAYLWIEVDGLGFGEPEYLFFWPVIAPLLVALRYGFAKGFLGALLTVLLPFLWITYYQASGEYSVSYAVGVILTAMIAGEFRDYWDETLQRKGLEHENMSLKLDSFTQNYYLLRASHDQLEQKIAGQVVSLRFSISELRKIVAKAPSVSLDNIARPVLSLFSDIIGIEVAGIYAWTNGKMNPKAMATLGDMPPINPLDPMVRDTCEYKVVFSPAKLEAGETHRSEYQLCVPILSSNNELLALVVVEQTKFFMLNQQNIALLALVSNCISDFLDVGEVTPLLRQGEGSTFARHLQRAIWNKQMYNASCALLVCRGAGEHSLVLYQRAIHQRRGVDIYWQFESSSGEQLLAVLLPMVSLQEAEQFASRLKQEYHKITHHESEALSFLGPMPITENAKDLQSLLKILEVENEILADPSDFHL